MLGIHTILHPTDFSPASSAAFHVACALARDYTARLVVLHVKPPDLIYGDGYVLPPHPEVVRVELQGQLNRLQAPDPAVPLERVLKEGDVVREILHAAGEVHADLLVLGTHGRTGVGRLLMGSIAEAVLRRAPCPVLTVRSGLPEAAAATEAVDDQVACGLGLVRPGA
jgi:nucleotide-binding universal stress UspA family protein